MQTQVISSRADAFFKWPDNPACRGCRYYRPIHDHGDGRRCPGRVCHYLLDTGVSRRCPFGRGCIRYRVQNTKNPVQ